MIDKKGLLLEVQHRLNNQYDLSRYVAEKIYSALGLTNKIEIDINQFESDINTLVVQIKEGLLKNTSGSIIGLEPLELSITIYKLWDCLNKDWLINDIQNTVSHELMHANIFNNTYNTYKECGDTEFIVNKINTQPNWYQNIMNAMQQLDCEDDLYKFMYAMYTCYYHEKQAFVAQSDTQIKKLLFSNNIKRISHTNASQILDHVDNYNIFIQNVMICDEIKEKNPFQQVEFLKRLNEYLNDGNKLSYNEFIKIVDNCKKVSISALKLIEKILVTAFYEINDETEKK